MRDWWPATGKRLGLLRQLRTHEERLLFLKAIFFALAVPSLLRLKLPQLATLLEPKHAPPMPSQERMESIVSIVDAALQFGRPLIRPGCLTRSIAQYYFLRRAGLDIDVCFGMGKIEGEFVGHCWLVKDGEPLMEMRDPRSLFQEIYRIPGTSAPEILRSRQVPKSPGVSSADE